MMGVRKSFWPRLQLKNQLFARNHVRDGQGTCKRPIHHQDGKKCTMKLYRPGRCVCLKKHEKSVFSPTPPSDPNSITFPPHRPNSRFILSSPRSDFKKLYPQQGGPQDPSFITVCTHQHPHEHTLHTRRTSPTSHLPTAPSIGGSGTNSIPTRSEPPGLCRRCWRG